MNSDDYDDDIADEDLVEALSQAGTSFSSRTVSGPPEYAERTLQNSFSRANCAPRPPATSVQRKAPGTVLDCQRGGFHHRSPAPELDDLPSDAFSSSPESRSNAPARPIGAPGARQGLARTSSGSFRQTTLWGGTVNQDGLRQSQPGAGRVYRGDQPPEVPSHHALDPEALKTWVYPTNLGTIRDYQFSIVKNGLFNNTLVALPTGLGKTFIAATVMLNYYRWTKNAKIVFVAPTKPLVAQQVDACFNIAGISRSTTTLLTGDTAPALRVDEWESKRVFFMTPQTLLNDLSAGYADPKSIVLLVIDEAHRSVGEYAYAKVVKLMRRFNNSFRVLALTATPGSKVETVQEVIDNLGISHVEIRTEESIDIRQYVHQRNIDQFVLDPSEEICAVKELFTKALKPIVDKLSQQNIYYKRDPMDFTTYGLMMAQKEWFAGPGRHANQGVQFMLRAVFGILTSIAHSIKLLTFHGIKPFYENMKDFRSETEGKGAKGSKYKKQLVADQSFQEMMDMMEKWFRTDGFVGHPKITALADTILNHFMDAGEGSATRVIVFSEYRDSAEEIVRGLNAHKPLINATVFVGQADSKRSEGMKQAQQIETIEKFKNGSYNVLVATSIGEEGLDIGQVDLIVCYDASSSPIRMLQRMGRTGRKRAGKIVLLLMRGKEEEQFAKSKDNYEQMQKLICEGSRFNFRHDLSTRIVPRDSRPEVDKRHIDIPIENTQSHDLPEPKKRRAPTKKKPPKKFHMPDGVETGFTRASALGQAGAGPTVAKRARPKQPVPDENEYLVDIPPLESVLLSPSDMDELDRTYRHLPYGEYTVEETELPSLTAFPGLQRLLRPVGKLKHGRQTKKFVKLFQKLARSQASTSKWIYPYGEEDESRYEDIPVKPFASDSDAPVLAKTLKRQRAISVSEGVRESEQESQPKRHKANLGAKTQPRAKTKPFQGMAEAEDDDSDRTIEEDSIPRRGRPKKGTSARRKPKAGKRTGRGINSDEIGDDCERDSDLLESDGSDSGGDLIGFIDDRLTSSIRREEEPSTSQTSTILSPLPSRLKGNSVYEPLEFPPSQDTDDGLPSLSQLLPTKRASAAKADSDEDTDVPRVQIGRQGRRRAVFDDSDSDG